jgi:hypothetical protein
MVLRTERESEWVGALRVPAVLMYIAAARARNSMGYTERAPMAAPFGM